MMTLADAQTILQRNANAAEGSFLFWLHEREQFDRASFWRLINAGIITGSIISAERDEVRWPAFQIYDGAMRQILWHYSPHDQCRIEYMPGPNLNEYLERLLWALEPLIQNCSGRQWDAPHPLANPYQSELAAYFRGSPDRISPDAAQDS